MTWCWQITGTCDEDLYSKGYLFATLYRLFRAGYYGNGLHITPNNVNIPKGFKELLLNLPLEIQENIVNKIWNEGKGYNTIIVRNNHPVIPLSLKFLFSLYGRVKHLTTPIIPRGFGAWKGGKISRTEYRFTYGKPEPNARVLLPDFIDRNPLYSTIVDFKMLCL